jgi:hypothetical protein
MKNLITIFTFSALFSCSSNQPAPQGQTGSKTESTVKSDVPAPQGIPVAHGKEFIKEQMNESYFNLEKAVKGLSLEQLEFKTSPGRWSIAETLEHIVKTEPALFGYVKTAMEQPANPEAGSEIKMSDDQILTMMTDRSHKATAPKELVPAGKYTDWKTALNDLQTQRKEILAYLDGVSMEDLRNHISDSPGGKVDSYQFFLFIPGHTMRHTLQILEIKADPNFPKK